MNRSESLTGIDVNDPDSAARAALVLRRQGVGCVVVTLGAAGIVIAD